jgi:hypothetical protein
MGRLQGSNGWARHEQHDTGGPDPVGFVCDTTPFKPPKKECHARSFWRSSHALYFFESNTRSASVLGVVGAGGIGYHLVERIRQNNWDEVAFLVLMILAAVTAIDAASRGLRLRIIRGPSSD